VTMLIYGTREANDMAWNPRSQTIFFRGLGVSAKIDPLAPRSLEPVEDDA